MPHSRIPGTPNLREAEIASIVKGIKSRLRKIKTREIRGMMRCYELVSAETGFPVETVRAVWRMMQPTTGIAADFIKARAFRMARRLVKEASPDQIINILERPNIGVLEPVKKVDSGGGGFFMNVSMDSLGSVSVAVAGGQEVGQLQPPQDALPEPESEDDLEEEGVLEGEYQLEPGEPEPDPEPTPRVFGSMQERDESMDPLARHRPRAPGKSKAYEEALAAAQVKLDRRKKWIEKRARQKAKSTLSSAARGVRE